MTVPARNPAAARVDSDGAKPLKYNAAMDAGISAPPHSANIARTVASDIINVIGCSGDGEKPRER